MNTRAICFTLLSIIAISMAASLPAQAQRARVFVSVNGNDANPCTGGSPCKTFQHAHDVVLPGGEISVLDTGGYGTLTIIKALSIVNPNGVEAAIATSSGQSAITINAGPSDVISLRGLTLDGTGVGQDGIVFNSGGALEVTDCVARGYIDSGLRIQPSAAATFKVTNSEFNDNATQGIVVAPNGVAQVTGVIDRAGLYNNFIGLNLVGINSTGGTISFTAKDSTASNNTNNPPSNGAGFAVQASTGQAVTHLMLVKSVAANNFYGIFVSGVNAKAFVNDSTITRNANGWIASSSGVIATYGSNAVDDNTSNESAESPATLK